MKIAAIMATRGNPKRAAAVIECARSLSSGNHEIQWIVGCDNDDPAETYAFFRRNYPEIHAFVEKRKSGVGGVWNIGAKAAFDADLIAPFPDDSWPGLPDWDETICENLSEPEKIGVIAWNDTANRNQCTLPVVTQKWFKLCGLYDDRFPYWFYDTCVAELWSFIVGRPVLIPKNLLLAAKKGKTKSMRELPFWWGFYVHTRKERLARAAKIRAHLGIDMAPDLLQNVLENWEYRDSRAAPHFDAMEKAFSAAEGEPSEMYRRAKANAESLMMEQAA